MEYHTPRPKVDERPTAYADRVGRWYLSRFPAKKALGQYFTPIPIAQFMAHLITPPGNPVRVLDPGSGVGILSCALCEGITHDVDLVVYEVDPDLMDCLETCLRYVQAWMKARRRTLVFRIVAGDFVLSHAGVLESKPQPMLDMFDQAPPSKNGLFDLIIANPPYFKLNKSDPRARAAATIVHGQPNIYAIFMAIGVTLLKENGQLVYITPRSYAAGSYFARFRSYFFSRARPVAIHLFDSRRDVFGEVLQESIILLAERSSQDGPVTITSSNNAADFAHLVRRSLSLSEVLNDEYVLHLPISEQNDQIMAIVRAWGFSLHDYGMKISTGPVVPFRAVSLISGIGTVPETHVPLLWMQNVKPMQVTWPLARKGQYLLRAGAEKLVLPNRNYVLLRRFRARKSINSRG